MNCFYKPKLNHFSIMLRNTRPTPNCLIFTLFVCKIINLHSVYICQRNLGDGFCLSNKQCDQFLLWKTTFEQIS